MIDKFETEIACNSYLLWKNKENAILIDPGFNANNCLINHINKLGLTITAILITHGHYDHIGALEDIAKAYPDAVTYISEECEDEITNPKINLSGYAKGNLLTFLPENTVKLIDGEVFNTSLYQIQLLHTPFHTKGSSCFYVEEEHALFSGDTLFESSIGRNDLPTGSTSSKKISESLSKITALPNDIIIYPGHGRNTNLEKELKFNSYLRNK